MNVLIVKLSAIGDVIHTLPALNALRRNHPDAHITWLVEADAADLVIGHRALDRVMVSNRKRWMKGLRSRQWKHHLAAVRWFIKNLRDTPYDWVLDFQALLKSGLLIAMTHGRRKIGFDRGMEHMEHSHLFLNERVPPVSMEIHAIDRNMIMLEAAGIRSRDIVYDVPIRESDRRTARDILKKHDLWGENLIVAVNPVAKWRTKQWDSRRFAALADRLISELGARVYFTGAHGDRRLIHGITRDMRHGSVNLAGATTLKILGALYERSDLLVSTDTGPMHLGAAVGIPVVAVFGPTAPWRTGPYGEHHRVVRADVFCSPCFKRRCPTQMECMAGVSVEQVLDAIKGVLRERGRSRPL